MTNVLMSDVFLLAPWLKDMGFNLEFGLPLSETVRALIARECYRGEEANYDFVGANSVETLQQANRLKEYILQYGINVDAIPLAAQEGDLLAGDLEE